MPNSPHTSSYAQRRFVGLALVLASAVAFSAKAIFIKLAYGAGGDAAATSAPPDVDPVTLLTMRMGLSLPLFAIIAIWSARGAAPLTRRDWGALCVLGFIGYYAASLLDFWGLQYISAALERLILFLNPTIVVVLSALFFAYRITRRDLLALAISYGGIALVFVHDVAINQERVLIGGALVLASAFLYAGYLVGAGQMVQRVGALRFAAYASLVSTFAIAVHFLLTRSAGHLAQPPRVWALAGAMAIFSTVLPVVMMAEGIRRIGSSDAAIASSIGPVATIFLGFVFLGEPITLLQLAGAALVTVGVMIISRKKK
jgi:drug/metabolite transporter (DMT)-like permease